MNDKPLRRQDVTCRQLDKAETMLFDPETEALHILNPTARLIWELCDGEHTTEDIVAAIKAQYTDTKDRDVLSEVQETLSTFTTQGLLQ